MSGAYDIGNRLELFIDDFLIQERSGLEFRLHTPAELPADPGKPDGDYLTVLDDNSRYLLYYRGLDSVYDGPIVNGNPGEYTGIAESRDGIHWETPRLGLFPGKPVPENAILYGIKFNHNFTPFIDRNPNAPASERYKAVGGIMQTGGLYAFHSDNGINWEKYPGEPIVRYDAEFLGGHGLDSQNAAFYSEAEKCYVMYYRVWRTSDGRKPLRTFAKATSDDFINWSSPEFLNPNMPDEHLYVSGLFPYPRAPHYYVGAATRFFQSRGAATDITLIFSRNGGEILRPFPGAWITPGLDPERWGDRMNYIAYNMLQTSPAELSFYLGRKKVRYTLRTDGFVSLHAGLSEGIWLSKELRYSSGDLQFNLATSAAGSFRIELLKSDGRVIPGFSFADFGEFYGDSLDFEPRWNGKPVPFGRGESFRFRIGMKECDLYSMRFSNN